jgi:hypothetical protein
MGFHWGDGPSQINAVVTVGGSGGAPTTAALLAKARTSKKASKAPAKGKPSKKGTAKSAERVVGFEIVYTNSLTKAQLTVRVPALGAFHDPTRETALLDAERLGQRLATVLNSVLHDKGDSKRRKK